MNDTYRFTPEDERHVIDAVARWWARSAGVELAERITAAHRLACHSIGCTTLDLRDSEVAWVAAVIDQHVAGVR